MSVVRDLLTAKADPLLGCVEGKVLPLDAAACYGHLGVVRELIRQVGIAGCGGESSGVVIDTLREALPWGST